MLLAKQRNMTKRNGQVNDWNARILACREREARVKKISLNSILYFIKPIRRAGTPLHAGCVRSSRYVVYSFPIVLFAALFFLQTKPNETKNNLDDIALQQSATEALGGREGTIIVIDPQTGRVRAVVNKEIAFEKALSPGSTIKPFTALTALKTGLINDNSTLVCRAPYKSKGFQIGCVHEAESPPFDLVHAIANSCNYFFGKLGEKINRDDFNATLSSFGFDERIGKLPRGRWKSRIAIGETEDLLVTPYNLINAYMTLVNNTNDINPEHRAILIEGMRGAVEYGTAAKANLDELSLNIFGKTGTASGDGNYRMQGWFVGFAADEETKGRIPNPDEIKLAVLVLIKGAHGSDSAMVSKQIFSTFASSQTQRTTDNGQRTNSVRVKIGDEIKTISIEEYVLGVVATESSFEDEIEALKAQAIASRTYALKHLQRHAKEGYDFCTLTHCQRYESINFSNASERLRRAVEETNGLVLRDANDKLIEAYFSASCGGMTANLQDLWGVVSKPYIKTLRDDFCSEMPHGEWNATISNENLLRAFQSDERTNIGSRLNRVQIIKRDYSGRAEMLLLSGEREKKIRGWDFKIIVGRALGWNLIKSSRFQIRRAGNNFVFVGSGFGHGLGLCQEGAHVMAERGFNYHQILARYFPTTTIGKL
jgi:SpoIID/LytB domain protein